MGRKEQLCRGTQELCLVLSEDLTKCKVNTEVKQLLPELHLLFGKWLSITMHLENCKLSKIESHESSISQKALWQSISLTKFSSNFFPPAASIHSWLAEASSAFCPLDIGNGVVDLFLFSFQHLTLVSCFCPPQVQQPHSSLVASFFCLYKPPVEVNTHQKCLK